MASYSASRCRFNIPEAPFRRDTGPRIPSLGTNDWIAIGEKVGFCYEGEMAEREKRAQQEIARKKMSVAPLYNKGGYQYITPETDPKTLGRK